MRHHLLSLTAALALVPGLAAQDSRTTSHPSLDDALVRQVIEREGMRPPRLQHAPPIGDPVGARALLIWKKNRPLRLVKLERAQSPGEVAPPPAIEIEEVEEEVVEEGPGGKRQPAAPKRRRATFSLGLRIATAGETTTVTFGGKTLSLVSDADHGKLLAALRKRAANPQLVGVTVEPGRSVSLQAVMTVCDAAREANLAPILFSGKLQGAMSPEDIDTIADLPRAMGWERPAPALHDGEVLLLVDGNRRWQDVARLYMQCAMARIWRISFVGVHRDGRRTLLPLPIPIDR